MEKIQFFKIKFSFKTNFALNLYGLSSKMSKLNIGSV